MENKTINRPDNKTRYFVLCTISTVLTVLSLFLAPFFAFAAVASTLGNGTGSITPSSMIMMLLLCGVGLVAALVLAIIAIATNKRKAWGIVCIIVDGLLVLAGTVLLIIVIAAGVSAVNNMQDFYASQYQIDITDSCPDDIRSLLDKHDFDVAIMDEDYDSSVVSLEIHIYISSNASREKIDDASYFLEELRALCDHYAGRARVYPVYFDPDDENSFIHLYDFSVTSNTVKSRFNLYNQITSAQSYMERVHGEVPDELEEGDILIVIQ